MDVGNSKNRWAVGLTKSPVLGWVELEKLMGPRLHLGPCL